MPTNNPLRKCVSTVQSRAHCCRTHHSFDQKEVQHDLSRHIKRQTNIYRPNTHSSRCIQPNPLINQRNRKDKAKRIDVDNKHHYTIKTSAFHPRVSTELQYLTPPSQCNIPPLRQVNRSATYTQAISYKLFKGEGI